MPAPESRSVFQAVLDPVLLHGLSLVSGFAANPSASEPAPSGHGALFSAVRGGCVPGWHRGVLSSRAALLSRHPSASSHHHRIPKVPSPALCPLCSQAAWG